MWKIYLLEISIAVVVAFLWVRGISKMQEEHPDYKGTDFLDWDDNKTHTEDRI